MQLTKPVYRFIDDGMIVDYNTKDSDKALNFTGPTWVDVKLGLVRARIGHHKVILTDNDLVAHDDYIDKLTNQIVVLAFDDKASKLRLKRAYTKLRDAGIKVRYFASIETANTYIERLK
jgi:hypothetical protein